MSSGAPKWATETWLAAVASRLILKSNESARRLELMPDLIASPYPNRVDPIAAGGSADAIDMSTGLTTLVIPVGYTFSVYALAWSFNAMLKGEFYYDMFLRSTIHEKSFFTHTEQSLLEDWYPLDPAGLAAHTVSFKVRNLSGHEMEGGFGVLFKLIEVGTPKWPKMKMVRCRVCKLEHKVDRRATAVKCPKCKKTTIYAPILFGNETLERKAPK